MLKLQAQQHIRFARIEQAQAWVVVAILVETNNGQTVAVSEPRIVRVIPKKVAALPGSISGSGLFLSAPLTLVQTISAPIISPFVADFQFSDFLITTGLGARPPTNN